MYFETACVLFLSLVTLSICQQDDEIIRQSFEVPETDGSYRWALQTGGGIFHEQRGSLRQGRAEEPALYVEGQYQYTAPDGQVINVLYTAGEDGFIATGAHIPTPPPIPPLIQRSLDYIASLRGDRTQGNGDNNYN